MKKLIHILLTLLIFVMSNTILLANDQVINPPEVVADGAILMDFTTGRVLYEKNADKPLAMASTTKIMTLILALESNKLDETVVVSKNASRAPKVRLNLSEGEEATLGDLLYPLMLESSNDCAVAIAEHLGGSVEGFSQMMNDKAKELGCLDTVFETPNGLDSGNHHSTARDMAIITRYCLNNEQFIEYINTPSKTIKTNKTTYTVNNKNKLLTTYDGANGVKTGYTNKAGQCFIGSAKRDDMQLISVALASGWGDTGKERKWIDTKNMLNYGFDNYKYYEIIKEGEVVGEINVLKTRTPKIPIAYDQSLMLPLNQKELDTIELVPEFDNEFTAPIGAGAIIGTVNIIANGHLLKTVGLETTIEAERHDFSTKAKNIIDTWINLGDKILHTI